MNGHFIFIAYFPRALTHIKNFTVKEKIEIYQIAPTIIGSESNPSIKFILNLDQSLIDRDSSLHDQGAFVVSLETIFLNNLMLFQS